MLQWRHEPLHRRPTRTWLSTRNPLQMLTPIQPHIMIRRLCCRITLVQHRLEQRQLLVLGRENEVGHAMKTVEFGNDLERVALVNQEPLPLG